MARARDNGNTEMSPCLRRVQRLSYAGDRVQTIACEQTLSGKSTASSRGARMTTLRLLHGMPYVVQRGAIPREFLADVGDAGGQQLIINLRLVAGHARRILERALEL